jgi:hypothetical protein
MANTMSEIGSEGRPRPRGGCSSIQHRDAGDTVFLEPLLNITAQHHNVVELSAEKAYVSVKNFKAIDAVGATPYIPFKSSHIGQRRGLLRKAFLYYQLHRDEFLDHYHKRSNVETTFSMIKAKFRHQHEPEDL